jgi:hypothetical protein
MKILKYEKLQETLFTNWTKYIDFKDLSALIINTLQLYANNWTTLIATKNFNTRKITLSKIDFTADNQLLMWFSFEVPYKERTAVGTLELKCAIGKQPIVSQVTGNFYLNNT